MGLGGLLSKVLVPPPWPQWGKRSIRGCEGRRAAHRVCLRHAATQHACAPPPRCTGLP